MIKKFSTMKVGDDVSFYALIEGLLLRFTPNKSSYYSANLSDGEQIVDARIWDTTIVENNNLEKGKVYYFDAHINEYGGKPQFVIKNARQVSEDEIDKKVKEAAEILTKRNSLEVHLLMKKHCEKK